MQPLPHRIRRLSLRFRATDPSQALALRKRVRDQLDTALLSAMERAFKQASVSDALLHLPRVHVQVRISSTDTLTGELVKCIEEELLKQLRTKAVTWGPASPALQTGPAGAEGMGRSGFAQRAPAGVDAPGGEPPASRQARVRMLVHYLETGSLPWPLARLDTAVATSELRDTASTAPPGVLDTLTGEPVSFPAQVAFWFRWLQLLPDASWPVLARAAAPPSSTQGTRLAEFIGALSKEQAGALPRYARLQFAAAAIAMARRTGGFADAGELAAIVAHVMGGGVAGRPEGIERTERLADSGESATSGRGSRARPFDGTESHASRAGENGRSSSPGRAGLAEEARLSAASELTSRLPEPAAAALLEWSGRLADSGESATSGSGSRAQPFDGTESHASRAGENGRSSSPGRAGLAEEARLSAASELTSRLPEPAAAALLTMLRAPSGPLHADAPATPTAAETSATRAGMAHGGPAGPCAEPPPTPGQRLQFHPEPSLAALRGGTSSAPFGQMVHHAGLVLLHPFLPRFFESTSIKDADKSALASGVLPRAAALLHRLAVEAQEAFEFELDFIKVLLGIPLDSPLPVSEGLLLASDCEEVEALLSAVIGHWHVLKSTSVKGLRGSFLQRPGLLHEEEQGFRLQVEPAPFDMLLGQLPWGIGTVKLPWMRKAIFTEWRPH